MIGAMRPLIWTDRRVAAAAVVLVGWLISIELGTSRRASRQAACDETSGEQVVDTTTGRLFDFAATTAVGVSVASSLTSTRPIRARRTLTAAGMVLLAGSGLLSRAARDHLGRFHRNSLTVQPDHELVDTGPYRSIRHPLYTATIGMFGGIGLLLGTRTSLTFAALPTAALIHRINVEEAMLNRALGDSYDNYTKRSSRLFPKIW